MSKKRGKQHLKRRGTEPKAKPVRAAAPPQRVNFYEVALTVDDDEKGVLRRAADAVALITPEIYELCGRLVWTTQHDPNCLGIAAPQVGASLRIFTVKDEKKHVWCFVNPEIERTESSFLAAGYEGCFSIPDKRVMVERWTGVTVTGMSPSGTEQRVTLTGLAARAAQHEMDHLSGVLIDDHGKLEPIKGDVIETGGRLD